MKYPKLSNWIDEAINLLPMSWSKFTVDRESRTFLESCMEIIGYDRKNWNEAQLLNIQIFRRIRAGYAVPIKDYWGYYVDKNSKIYRLGFRAKELTQTMTVKGYMVVNLNNGKQVTHLVHRLVADHHVENTDPTKLTDVHHLNNNRSDNEDHNLMWTSHAANVRLVRVKEYVPADRICAYCGEISPSS